MKQRAIETLVILLRGEKGADSLAIPVPANVAPDSSLGKMRRNATDLETLVSGLRDKRASFSVIRANMKIVADQCAMARSEAATATEARDKAEERVREIWRLAFRGTVVLNDSSELTMNDMRDNLGDLMLAVNDATEVRGAMARFETFSEIATYWNDLEARMRKINLHKIARMEDLATEIAKLEEMVFELVSEMQF